MGTICAEKPFFALGIVQLPAVAELRILMPGIVPGMVSAERVFPPRDIASPTGVSVAVRVALLLTPPGEVVGEEGFLGKAFGGEAGKMPMSNNASPTPGLGAHICGL